MTAVVTAAGLAWVGASAKTSARPPTARSAVGSHLSTQPVMTERFSGLASIAYLVRPEAQALLRELSTPDSLRSCAVRPSPLASARSAKASLKRASSAGLITRLSAVNASPQS